MNREELIQFIKKKYHLEEEYPWLKYPNYTVFRHHNNQKWFALIMNIPKCNLGLTGNENIDILNVKCNPLLIGSLRQEQAFYPAYHMNKENWITVVLDNSVDDEKIKWLLEMSYELTDTTKRTKKTSRIE